MVRNAFRSVGCSGGRVGGQQRAQQPVVDLGVEERDALPVTGVLEQPPFVQRIQLSHLSHQAVVPGQA